MHAVLKRLREPSTWAGISALLVLVGVETHLAREIVNVAAALAGLAAVIMASPNGDK